MASPACSVNMPLRKLGLGGGLGAAVSARAGSSAASNSARTATTRLVIFFSMSGAQHALVQAADRVQCRCDRALLPGRNARDVLARKNDAAIQGAHIVVMRG